MESDAVERLQHALHGWVAYGIMPLFALANAGVPVVLHEMRPVQMTDAHHTEKFAELVCSNSFRSDDWRGNAGFRQVPRSAIGSAGCGDGTGRSRGRGPSPPARMGAP